MRLSLALVCAIGAATAATAQSATTTIDGDTVIFTGDIFPQTIAAFFDVTADLEKGDVTKLLVNSPGGDTGSGRELGRWVHQMGLDVEVDTMCFSSCANYIFPAGGAKIIRDGAFVGWHGSDIQSDIMALSDPERSGEDIEREELRKALIQSGFDGADLDETVEANIQYMNESKADEAAFYDMLGVSGEFAIHGLRPEHIETFFSGTKGGWTFSIDDMAKLGLQNVSYLGEGAYHESPNVAFNLFVPVVTDDYIEN